MVRFNREYWNVLLLILCVYFIAKWTKNNNQEGCCQGGKPQATKKIYFIFTKSNLFYLSHFLGDRAHSVNKILPASFLLQKS